MAFHCMYEDVLVLFWIVIMRMYGCCMYEDVKVSYCIVYMRMYGCYVELYV